MGNGIRKDPNGNLTYLDPKTGKWGAQKPGTTPTNTPIKPGAGTGTPNGSGLLGTNLPNANFSDPNSVIETGLQAGAKTGTINNQLTNADYNSWGGNQTTTIDPKTGKATVNYGLSQPNQSILSNQQQAGQNSYNLLNGFLSGNGSDPNNPLSQLQKSNYNSLTGAGQSTGLDQTYQRDKEQRSQDLANRGIPVGSQAYNTEMNRLDEGYGNQKQKAQDSAYQSSWGQIPTLSNMGQQGFVDPKTGQTAAFQGNAFQGPSAQDIYGTFQGGQNVAGTNASNQTIGAGHDRASIESAALAGKYALMAKLAGAANPTFGDQGAGNVFGV